jgi:diaminopimelate decarboxylase
MNHFELKGGELACEDVPLARIAAAVGTPVYVYSLGDPGAALHRCCATRWPSAGLRDR